MTVPDSNLVDFLLGEKAPEQIALRLPGRDHTYGEIQSAVEAIAGYLLGIGVQKGDRGVLVSENSFFWVAAYLGMLRAGVVAVPLPTNVLPDDLDFVLRSTNAQTAFVQVVLASRSRGHFPGIHLVTDRQAPGLPESASQTTLDKICLGDVTARRLFPPTEKRDLAALMFTSGSTGRPRGVMVSHANIMANTDSIIQYLQLSHNDRIMTVLPFHYCFGASLLHTHLRVGGSLVIDPRFMYPEVVLQRMIETECTGFAGVPSHFQILLRNSSLRKKTFPHLRYVQQAGGHLARFFIPQLRESLPGTQIFIMYGQTEATARLSYLPPELLKRKLGSIGRGIPGVKLQVLDVAGREIAPGEVGEIVAEGESITQGYWQDPEETAKSFREGRLYTGDLATVDEDGFIYVVDRDKDFLKCGGRRISCRQVEDRLLRFEGVLEVAVIGVPDEVLGEAIKAFVVPANSEFAELAGRLSVYCKESFPLVMIPRDIVVVPCLPKSSAGKVLKRDLRTR